MDTCKCFNWKHMISAQIYLHIQTRCQPYILEIHTFKVNKGLCNKGRKGKKPSCFKCWHTMDRITWTSQFRSLNILIMPCVCFQVVPLATATTSCQTAGWTASSTNTLSPLPLETHCSVPACHATPGETMLQPNTSKLRIFKPLSVGFTGMLLSGTKGNFPVASKRSHSSLRQMVFRYILFVLIILEMLLGPDWLDRT